MHNILHTFSTARVKHEIKRLVKLIKEYPQAVGKNHHHICGLLRAELVKRGHSLNKIEKGII